jgi:arylsulfatase A-like enzyme
MYGDGRGREQFTLWPPYQDPQQLATFMAQTTQEELRYIRSQYCGKLAMVDHWFGKLLEALDQHMLWETTIIVVTTDHGHDLGERGKFGKQYPHVDSHANIPLFIWHPRFPSNGRVISALTSTVDLFATILEAADVSALHPAQSRSLLPLLRGEQIGAREAVLYGTFGQGVCCTDGEWTIFKSPEHDGPLYYYSSMVFQTLTAYSTALPTGSGHFVPNVDLPQWQVPVRIEPLSRENFFFARSDDPGQTRNLWKTASAQRRRMLDVLRDLLAEEGTPPEQYTRLGLTAT